MVFVWLLDFLGVGMFFISLGGGVGFLISVDNVSLYIHTLSH